jgi:hypothetical protein
VEPLDVTSRWDAGAPEHLQTGGPPVTLTTDGPAHRLPLRELEARVVVEGPLALTELRLVFENPEDFAIGPEAKVPYPRVPTSWATFDLRLPPGGEVARFAVEQAHGWQEAEMVPASHARKCFLLGWTPQGVTAEAAHEPGHFRANVYPIAAHSRKTIVVAYAQPLVAPGELYLLPLSGLGELDRFRASVQFPLGPKPAAFSVHKDAWTPDRDWVADPGAPQPSAMRSGSFAVARIARGVEDADPDPVTTLALLVDTSASRSGGLRADAERVASILNELARTSPQASVRVGAFDQDVEPIYGGPPAGFGPPEMGRVVARGALGATDLGAALRWAARQGAERVVLLSDGVATVGGRSAGALSPELDLLRAAGARRLDAPTSDDEAGASVLAALATKLERRGVVFGIAETPGAVVARMSHAAMEPLEVRGAVWSWPRETRAGSAVLVFAELPRERPFDVRVSGTTLHEDPRDAASPLLPYEAARANVERLEKALEGRDADAGAEPIRASLVELSTKFRVPSREAGWIVPLSKQRYSYFGIDLSSRVLGVGPGGVQALPRPSLDLLDGKPGGEEAERPPSPSVKPCEVHLDSNALWRSPILFEKGGHPLGPSEMGSLATELRQKLPSWPAFDLEVEGYSRESSVEVENMRVSRARAVAFRDALAKLGVKARARGYGSMPTRPGLVLFERVPVGDKPREDVQIRVVAKNPLRPLGPAPFRPFTGELAEILSQSDKRLAHDEATAWHQRAPSDPISALALGMTDDALGDTSHAARAYGSLVDLAPRSASAFRSAATFLEKDAPSTALELLRSAGELEHHEWITSQGALALALARSGAWDEATDVLLSTLEGWERWPGIGEVARMFVDAPSTLDVLEQDVSIFAAAAARAHPDRRAALEARLRPFGLSFATKPLLQFLLSWESRNDVDLEVEAGGRRWDPRASIDRDALPGEGLVLADSPEFGPEAYVVNGPARAYPYRVLAYLHDWGNVLGRLDVVEYDGDGRVRVESHPFVVQARNGTVEVATVRGPLREKRVGP